MVTTSGLRPDGTGIPWDINKLPYPFYVTAANLSSRSTYAFSNVDFGIYKFHGGQFYYL